MVDDITPDIATPEDFTNCFFCDAYNDKAYVWDTEYFYSRFNRFPLTPGHSELIPKRHIRELTDLTEKEWADLLPALQYSKRFMIGGVNLLDMYTQFSKETPDPESEWYHEMMINKAGEKAREFSQRMLTHVGISALKKPDGYNIGVNDGLAAGRTVHHLHIHVIPRYFGDVKDPRGGIRYIMQDPDIANYKR